MASNTVSQVFRGPHELHLDSGTGFATVGIINDPRVAIELLGGEETGEPFGPVPFGQFHDGCNVRVTCAIQQTTAEHLEIAARAEDVSGVVYFNERPGRATTYGLKLVPIQGKSGAGGVDAATSILMLYSVAVESIDEIVAGRGEARSYNVTFRALVATGRTAGKRIGYWQRPSNA